jgi:hypothetical protein
VTEFLLTAAVLYGPFALPFLISAVCTAISDHLYGRPTQ